MAHESPTTGFLVWRLSLKWRSAVDKAVAPLGLTHAQYSVLASLYGVVRSGRRPSQRELADHTGMEPIYVSKLVRALEAAGLVERAGNPADTRAVQLSLTPSGVETADKAVVIVLALQDQITAPLGGNDSERTRAFRATLQTLLATDTGDPP
jgi:DNA-binding MarR family transcriptional regulator